MICNSAIDRPLGSIAVFCLLTVVAATGIQHLSTTLDGTNLIPWNDPVSADDRKFREIFNLGDPIVVVVDTGVPDGIFNHGVLTVVDHLTSELGGLKGVAPHGVLSLATESSTRVRPGSLEFLSFLDPLPETSADLARLKTEINKVGILTGFLVSEDFSVASIIVRTPSLAIDQNVRAAQRALVYSGVKSIVSQFVYDQFVDDSSRQSMQVSIAGSPVAEIELGTHIQRDLLWLTPLAALVISVSVWVSLPRVGAVGLVLAKCGACVLFTFGLMGWFGSSIEITTALMPVALISTSVSDEVFVLWRLLGVQSNSSKSSEQNGIVEEARLTMRSIALPACITSLMMAVGFAAFTTSEIAPIASFGFYSAVGVLYCLAWTLIVTPALLATIGGRMRPSTSLITSATILKATPQLLRPMTVLMYFSASVIAMSAGLCWLRVDDSWNDAFPENSEVKKSTRIIDSRLGGANTLYLFITPRQSVTSRPHADSASLLNPDLLNNIAMFEESLASRPDVGAILGPAGHIRSSRYIYSGFREEYRTVPNSSSGISEIIRSIDTVRGAHRRRETISDDMQNAAILLLVRNANFSSTQKLLDAIHQAEKDWLRPFGYEVVCGGDLALSQAMISYIVESQVNSACFAIVGVVFVVYCFTRSLCIAVLAVTPSFLAAGSTLGLMGYLDLELGVATSMMCAMSLGIGADYTLYFLHSLQKSEARNGAWSLSCTAGQIANAIHMSGPAILTSSISVGLGFLSLLMSVMPINSRLGVIVTCAVVISALGALYGVPASFMLWRTNVNREPEI